MPACHQCVYDDRNSHEKSARILEKTIQQKNNFWYLSLLIKWTRAQKKEFKELSQNVMNQQPRQNTETSILSRQTKLINCLNEIQLQFDLLDDDVQLSQSSGRKWDDANMISSKGNRSHGSTPVSIDNNEYKQLRSNLEQHKSSWTHKNQPPASPYRPGKPMLFLQGSISAQTNFERFRGAHKRQTEMQHWEISQQEQNLEGTENHVPNPFTQAQWNTCV